MFNFVKMDKMASGSGGRKRLNLAKCSRNLRCKLVESDRKFRKSLFLGVFGSTFKESLLFQGKPSLKGFSVLEIDRQTIDRQTS